jgi:hypothetical protein
MYMDVLIHHISVEEVLRKEQKHSSFYRLLSPTGTVAHFRPYFSHYLFDASYSEASLQK